MIFSPELVEVIGLSLYVALISIAVATPVALAFAWALHTYDVPGKSIINTVLQLPLVLPPVALGYLLILTLGKKGIVGSYLFDLFGIQLAFTSTAAIIAAVIVSFPLIIRSIQTAFEMAPQGLETAAATLGATPLRQFFTITLPLVAPGILSGAVLGFARALGEFGATITFAGNIAGATQTLPLKIYALMQTPGKENEALGVTLCSVVLAFASMIVASYITRRSKNKRRRL
ncbi:MAG: molybdate ABC transporter permease subunit [Fibrobacterales bacterium]